MKFKSLATATNHAWYATFRPFHEEKIGQRARQHGFLNYFLGFPQGKNRGLAIFFYVILGGFIFTPLKNFIKMLTEFPLALLRFGLVFLEQSMKHSKSLFGGPLYEVFRLVTLCVTIAHLLVRTLTSPITSAREAARVHPVLGLISVLFSLAGLSLITIALAPFIAVCASSFGLTSFLAVTGNASSLSQLASGILLVLSEAGFVITAPMVGAAIIATCSAFAYALNATREYLTELPVKPKYSSITRKNYTVVQENVLSSSRSWVDMLESGLQKTGGCKASEERDRIDEDFFILRETVCNSEEEELTETLSHSI